jgi:phosphohistidine phosphatase SixA
MHHADRSRDSLGRLVGDQATNGRSAEQRLLIVVRHGDAGDPSRWEGPDLRRPLSPLGRRQAEGLVLRLEDYPVERILCSPTLRCRQTVEPLARDRWWLEIEPVTALGVDAGPAEVRSVFWDWWLYNTVLCTHGETIRQLFRQLVVEGFEAVEPVGLAQGFGLAAVAHPATGACRYLASLALDPVQAR